MRDRMESQLMRLSAIVASYSMLLAFGVAVSCQAPETGRDAGDAEGTVDGVDSSEIRRDASDSGRNEDGTTVGDGSLPPCDQLDDAFSKLIEGNRDCDSDDDCAFVFNQPWCDCVANLASSPVAINKRIWEEANAYHEKYKKCPDADRLCDVPPPERVYCDDGTCRNEYSDQKCF